MGPTKIGPPSELLICNEWGRPSVFPFWGCCIVEPSMWQLKQHIGSHTLYLPPFTPHVALQCKSTYYRNTVEGPTFSNITQRCLKPGDIHIEAHLSLAVSMCLNVSLFLYMSLALSLSLTLSLYVRRSRSHCHPPTLSMLVVCRGLPFNRPLIHLIRQSKLRGTSF
jgi:hypothetical protein